MRVLFVEDDSLISRDIVAALEAEKYIVEHENDGEQAWFLGDTEDYAAVILDIGLPTLDGLTILKRWRANDRSFPVLLLTARGMWTERVEGIDAGADDYLAKPFHMPELLARLRAIVRRSSGQSDSLIKVGNLWLDDRHKRVTLDGLPIELTPLEYRCLQCLCLNADRIVSQLELIEQIYSQDFERESNAIEVLIGRLRRKLGDGVITNRRGFGYTVCSDDSKQP